MPNFNLNYTGDEINTLLSKIDETGDEMKRYIVKLVKQGNDYVIQDVEGEQLDFEGLSQTIRDTSKYVVMVYGNSKLRPQYVSGSEMMFIGLDRASQNSKVLRVLFTATRCTYEVFELQEQITDLATIRIGAGLGATALQSVPDTYALKTYVDNHHDNTKQDVINDLATIRNGASAGATAVQPNDLLEKSTETWQFTLSTGEVVERKVVLGE